MYIQLNKVGQTMTEKLSAFCTIWNSRNYKELCVTQKFEGNLMKNLILTKKSIIVLLWLAPQLSAAVEHVILVSVDGLRPQAIAQMDAESLPSFYRFRQQGVWTDNARSDFDYTRTLPNHASMITARGVIGANGHGQISNGTPADTDTLHNNTDKEAYVTSVFDVVHDHGLSTAMYASKSKFVLYDQSYNAQTGSKDLIGEDNGRDKIDRYEFISPDRSAFDLTTKFVADIQSQHYHFSMIHLADTDSAGHGDNWTTPEYLDAVKRIDSYLQQIFFAIDSDTQLTDNTAIILVADHGGAGRAHSEADNINNYTIPFYVWSPDISEIYAGKDLYALNLESRVDPGSGRPDYAQAKQPIRNGDAANLALSLLGLPAIADVEATINAKQDLRLSLSD